MSRHLIIRCDAPGCDAQTETNASDTEPTSVEVPHGWLTLIAPDRAHRHYCSEACLHAEALARATPTVPTAPAAQLAEALDGRALAKAILPEITTAIRASTGRRKGI